MTKGHKIKGSHCGKKRTKNDLKLRAHLPDLNSQLNYKLDHMHSQEMTSRDLFK